MGTRVPQLNVLYTNIETIKIVPLKFSIFTTEKKNISVYYIVVLKRNGDMMAQILFKCGKLLCMSTTNFRILFLKVHVYFK